MCIDTLYFHYVVILKKTDLSRFFFKKMGTSIGTKKYILNFVKERADSVIVQEFSFKSALENKNHNGTNIIVRINPASNTQVLIGAHWDTRPLADQDEDSRNYKTPILGANDGASGVAVLLELADVLNDNRPNIGINLVFFDAEDVGINGQPYTFAMGSEYFSKNLPIEKPNSAIIVDMVGDKYLKIPIERFSYQVNPEMVKEIWSLANDLGLSAFEYRVGYEIYDDHVPLWENAQIPAIDIIDFDYPNLFYNYWHTQNDIPENCSPQSLYQVGTLLLNYIYD